MFARHALCLAALALGCAPTLQPNEVDAGPLPDARPWTGEGVPPTSGAFSHTAQQSAVATVVDATDDRVWHHLDMDSGRSVSRTEGWELAFSRFRVRINGGVTGSGGVQVAELDGLAFEDVTRAPDEGWTAPVADGEGDDDEEPDNAFNDGVTDWYDYEVETHTLTPRVVTYVVSSSEGGFFKLGFEGYYDAAGSPASVSFRWAAIEPPMSSLPDAGMPRFDAGPALDAGPVSPYPEHAFELHAESPTDWVYLSVEAGLVTPSDPERDLGWDLAFRRSAIRTNSGTSGDGAGGAREATEELDYEAIESAPDDGFAPDEIVDSGVPGAEPESLSPVLAGWYDYEASSHRVTAGERNYLLRRADGGLAKLRIWSWSSGLYWISLIPIDTTPLENP